MQISLGISQGASLPSSEDNEIINFLNNNSELLEALESSPEISIYPSPVTVDKGFSFNIPSKNVDYTTVKSTSLELLNILETFVRLKSDIINKFNAIVSNNWPKFRAAYNVAIVTAIKFHEYLLKIISFIKKFCAFTLNLFTNFRVALPNFSDVLNIFSNDNGQDITNFINFSSNSR